MRNIQEADQELPRQDIVKFLKEKKGIIAKSLNWWGPFRSRALALVAMKRGYFSFGEFCRWSLPSSSGVRSRLSDRYNKFLYEESKREYPGSLDDHVNLFGHKFWGPDYHEVIGLINEVIVLDQYHANQFLKKDSVVIDAGANIGTFSVFAASLASQGRVYAFEPAAKAFRALKENTEEYFQVVCENFGLGDGASQKNIFVDIKSTGGSVFEDSPYYQAHAESVGKNVELVKVITIDAFVAERGISRVDLIKMDTEGYEAKILQGAKETIKKWKPVIAMSAYHNPNDKKVLPQLLKSICPNYICQLHKESEEDLICYVTQV